MVTAVISDLHLGTRTRADLLRRSEVRAALMSELQSVDAVVLLGDTIELRDGAPAHALHAATPFFEDLGEALSGGRVTLVAGNHDYQLASAWLGRRQAGGAVDPLGLEQLSTPARGDPLAQLAGRMGHTELVLGHPGVWIRPGVYATHGHYLDCHNAVPTFECLACAVMEKLMRAPRNGYRTPDDYEAVLAPLYRIIYRITQSRRARPAAALAKALVRSWEGRGGHRGHDGRTSRLRPGLEAMGTVVDCLGIEADYVIFGHLHRAWPVDGAQAWRTERGTTLVNAGSWVCGTTAIQASPTDSPYRPGTCVFVRDDGPPELRHLLDVSRTVISPKNSLDTAGS